MPHTDPDQRRQSTRESTRRRRARLMAQGLCYGCGRRPPEAGLRKTQVGRCPDCHRRELEGGRRRNARLRQEAFARYGGPICACCGETEDLFLTIDHIDGGGTQHRKRMQAETGSLNLYDWLARHGYPPGYQVLCMNCNLGKYRNGGVCPHEDRRRKPD